MSNALCRFCGTRFDPAAKPEMCRDAPASVLYHTEQPKRTKHEIGGGPKDGPEAGSQGDH